MDKPPRSPSSTGERPVGCNDTAPCPVDTKVKKKTGKKKKNNHKKRQSPVHQMKTGSECTVEEQSSSSQVEPISKNENNTRSAQPPSATCDQSTQTESPQHWFQTQSTQTPPIQSIHSPSAESKSTQTQHTSFSLQQAYWGKSSIEQSTDEQKIQSSSTNSHLTVISWNIDGLDTENIYDRVKGLLSQFGKYRADIVLLQELVPGCLTILQSIMKDYQFLQGSEDGYFTSILLRKNRVQFQHSSIVKYPTTEMGRNLLTTHVSFFGHPLCIMTSHLESCKASSQERLNQLRRVWKWMKEAPEDHTVIFGGDTNLRDWEVKKLGGLPDGITDVWEMLGKPEESRYTWDTSINDNKEIPDPIRLRFDRLFLRVALKGVQLQPESMTLIGLEKLQCDYFISDHWGILCTFAFGASEEERVTD